MSGVMEEGAVRIEPPERSNWYSVNRPRSAPAAAADDVDDSGPAEFSTPEDPDDPGAMLVGGAAAGLTLVIAAFMVANALAIPVWILAAGGVAVGGAGYAGVKKLRNGGAVDLAKSAAATVTGDGKTRPKASRGGGAGTGPKTGRTSAGTGRSGKHAMPKLGIPKIGKAAAAKKAAAATAGPKKAAGSTGPKKGVGTAGTGSTGPKKGTAGSTGPKKGTGSSVKGVLSKLKPSRTSTGPKGTKSGKVNLTKSGKGKSAGPIKSTLSKLKPSRVGSAGPKLTKPNRGPKGTSTSAGPKGRGPRVGKGTTTSGTGSKGRGPRPGTTTGPKGRGPRAGKGTTIGTGPKGTTTPGKAPVSLTKPGVPTPSTPAKHRLPKATSWKQYRAAKRKLATKARTQRKAARFNNRLTRWQNRRNQHRQATLAERAMWKRKAKGFGRKTMVTPARAVKKWTTAKVVTPTWKATRRKVLTPAWQRTRKLAAAARRNAVTRPARATWSRTLKLAKAARARAQRRAQLIARWRPVWWFLLHQMGWRGLGQWFRIGAARRLRFLGVKPPTVTAPPVAPVVATVPPAAPAPAAPPLAPPVVPVAARPPVTAPRRPVPPVVFQPAPEPNHDDEQDTDTPQQRRRVQRPIPGGVPVGTATGNMPHHLVQSVAGGVLAALGSYSPPPERAQEDFAWFIHSLGELDREAGRVIMWVAQYMRGTPVHPDVPNFFAQVATGCATVGDRNKQAGATYETRQKEDLDRARHPRQQERAFNV